MTKKTSESIPSISSSQVPRGTAVLVAGTLLLATALPAAANEGRQNNFRPHHRNDMGGGRAMRAMMNAGRGNGPRSEIAPPAVQRNAGNPGLNLNHNRSHQRIFRANSERTVNQTFQLNDSGQMLNMHNGVTLDLGSSERTITLGAKLFAHQSSVSIETSGGARCLVAGSQVTAAEYVAAKQILSGGNQEVLLDAGGRATGGKVDLSAITSNRDSIKADDLYIPQNVATYGDFGRGSNFQIKGDLINAGSLYALSSRQGTTSGVIRADNISNQVSGVIDASVNLTLRAENTLNNEGVISASGDLTLSAGTLVKNAGGSVSARGNLTVEAPQIANSGSIAATAGNVTLDAPAVLNVDNSGGTISALNGAINLRDSSYRGSFDTNLSGGDLLSEQLNVTAGQATADIFVNELTGTINETGLASHVVANTDVLHIGTVCLTGDPTYRNDSGDISIDGDITVQEALTFIASGDIFNSTDVTITAGDATTGYPITFIAGANIIAAAGNTPNVGPIPPALAGAATTIDGTTPASATGGSIFFGDNSPNEGSVTINSRTTATSGDHNGGDVQFFAFADAGLSQFQGIVSLNGTSINTGGLGTGNNGNISIVAGGVDPILNQFSAIVLGNMDTTGGTGAGTGTITVQNAQPASTTPGGNVTYAATGQLTSLDSLIAGPVVNKGGVFITGVTNAANLIDITSGPTGIGIEDGASVNSTGSTGTSQIDLTVPGAAPIFATGDSNYQAFNINLTSGSGNIGDAGTFIGTNAVLTTVNTTGNLFLFNANNEVPNFDINANDIVIVTLGTIMHDMGLGAGGFIVGNTVNLNCLNGNIGLTDANRCEVQANVLVLNSQRKTFVHNNNAGLTTLAGGPMGTERQYHVSVDGDLSMASNTSISAEDIVLDASGDFINIQGGMEASKSISLISNGLIDNSVVSATLDTPLLILNSIGNNVGASSANRFVAGTAVDSVQASSGIGSVFLSSLKSKGFKLTGGSANNNFDFLGVGSYAVTGNINTLLGDINLTSTVGTISIGAAKGGAPVGLKSGNNINVAVTDLVGFKKSFIKILDNTNIESLAAPGFGDITFSVGASGPVVPGVQPLKGIQAGADGANSIFWGQFGVTAKTSKKTVARILYAQGADIIFNNPVAAKNIVLGSNVRIVADPVPAGSSGDASGTGAGSSSSANSNAASNTGGGAGNLHPGRNPGTNQGRQGRANNKSISKFDDDFVSMQYLAAGTTDITDGADFDLSSNVRNILLGQDVLDGDSSVTIVSGGVARTLTAGSLVTASEYIAVNQVLVNGEQRLVLDGGGRATGGQVDLSVLGSEVRIQADDLYIPANVTAYADFGRRSNFQVGGDLTNAGSIYALSSRNRADGILVRADSISNEQGGLISSVVPQGIDLGRRNARPVQDLILHSDHDLSNSGTIESSGALTLSAAGSIHNNQGAAVTTDGTVSLLSSNLKNAGSITSNNGNVNIDSLAVADLVVENKGGTISAVNGAINLRTPDNAAQVDTGVYGGNLFSKELNVYGGQGTADVFVDQLTGQINQTGYASHVQADTETLTLGNICLTGDPTFSNTGGSINITGNIIVNEDLAIIARNSISSTVSGTFASITAQSPGGDGFNITFVAGFNVTAGGTSGSIPPGVSTLTTIDGSLATTGGNVQLQNLLVNASGTGANSNGGNITVIAAASGGVLGQFFQQSGFLTATGTGTGTNGNITIIAGGVDSGGFKAIEVNPVASGFGTGGGGNILISNTQPMVAGGPLVTWSTTGVQSGGTFVEGAIPGGPAGINFRAPITGFDNVTINSGNNSQVILQSVNGSANTIRANAPLGSVNINLAGSTDFVLLSPPSPNFKAHVLGRFINFTGGTGDIGSLAAPVVLLPAIANGPMIVSALTGATGDVHLNTPNTNLSVFEASGNTVFIDAVGTIATPVGGFLTANSLGITSTTGSIGITESHRLQINALNVALQAPLGDIFVANNTAFSTDVAIAKARNVMYLSSLGNINSTGTEITAAKIVDIVSGGSIASLGNTISTNTLRLASLGTLNLPTVNFLAPNLELTSFTGDVGASLAVPMDIQDNHKSVVARSFSGDVFLGSNSTNTKNPLALSGSAFDGFSYDGNFRSLTLGDLSTVTGDLNIVTQRTTITVNPDAKLTSGQDILLQVSETVSPDSGKTKITFGKDSTIETFAPPGFGNIEVILGTNGAGVDGPEPKETAVLEVNGNLFFGTLGIGGKNPKNIVVAKGADIKFSSPIKAANITLGGGVVMVADPPVIPGLSIMNGPWSGLMSASEVQSARTQLQTSTEAALQSNSTPDSALHTAPHAIPPTVSHAVLPAVSQIVPVGLAPPVEPNQIAAMTPAFTNHSLLNQLGTINLVECGSANPMPVTTLEDDSYIVGTTGYASEVGASVCSAPELFAAVDQSDSRSLKGEHMKPADRIDLTDGTVLFVPDRDITVKAACGTIEIKARSVVLVTSDNNKLAVYNLDDYNHEAVVVDVSGRRIALNPGRHVLATREQRGDYAGVNPIEAIAHRSLTNGMHNGVKLYLSEFSIPSAIEAVTPVKALTRSQHPLARKAAHHMFKTTAAVLYVTGGNGSYQLHTKPRLTAIAH